MSAVAPLGWDTLRAALPEASRAIPLAKLILPTRIENYADRIGLRTLGELAARSEAEIVAVPHLGRRSLHDAAAGLRGQLAHLGIRLAAPIVPALRRPPDWDALRATLPAWSLGIPLEDVGLPGRLRAHAARAGLRTLGDLAERSWDELFAEHAIGRLTLRRMCVAVQDHLEGRMRVEPSGEGLEEAWELLRARAERAPAPAPLAAFHALIDPFQDRLGTEVALVLMERLEALLHVEEQGGEPVVTGVRRRASRLAPRRAGR